MKDSPKDPSKFWKTLKSKYSTETNNKQSLKTLDVDGVNIRDPNLIADAFSSFFTSIATTLKEKAFPFCNFSWKRPTKMPKKTVQKFIFKMASRQ